MTEPRSQMATDSTQAPTQTSPSPSILRKIGKVTIGLFAVVGGVSGVRAAYDWLYPHQATFSVQTDVEPFTLPKPLKDVLANNPVEDEERREIVRSFDNLLRRHVKVVLTNTGDRLAKNVALQIGANGLAIVGDQAPQNFKNRLELGDCATGDTIEAEWWDDSFTWAPSKREILISHDEGLQEFTLPELYTGFVSAFFGSFGFLGSLLIIAIPLSVAFLVAYIADLHAKFRRLQTSVEEELEGRKNEELSVTGTIQNAVKLPKGEVG